jgi:hypothetical protein
MHRLERLSFRARVFTVLLACTSTISCKPITSTVMARVPEQKLPELPIPPAPPPPGKGLVVIDSTSGSASIARVTGETKMEATHVSSVVVGNGYGTAFGLTRANATELAPVCEATPCAAYLPYGQHQLVFESNDEDGRRSVFPVTSSDTPTAMRVTLNDRVPGSGPRPLGGAMMVGGGLVAALGIFMVAASFPETGVGDPHASADDWTKNRGAGVGLLGLGVGLVVLGAYLFGTATPPRKVVGQSVQWRLDAAQPARSPAPPANVVNGVERTSWR